MKNIKFFMLMFIPMMVILFLIINSIIVFKNQNIVEIIKNDESNLISSLNESVNEELNRVLDDIVYISSELNNFKFDSKDNDNFLIEVKAVEDKMINLMKFRGLYENFAYTSTMSEEIFDIDYNKGEPKIIFDPNIKKDMLEKLEKMGKLGTGLGKEEKSKRKESSLKKNEYNNEFSNEILIHPMELNVNYLNKIERPHKPVITFEIPIFDQNEKIIKGYLRVKYLAKYINADFERVVSRSKGNSEIYLLNPEGYYLVSPNKRELFAFMFEQGTGAKDKLNNRGDKVIRFKKAFRFDKKNGDEWIKIKQSENGQFLEEKNGLFSYDTFTPNYSDKTNKYSTKISSKFYWKIVSKVSKEKIEGLKIYNFSYFSTEFYSFSALILLLTIVSTIFRAKREAAEVMLVASETKFKEIFSLLGEGVIVLDNSQEVLLMNLEAENLLGFKKHEFIGHNLHSTIGHKDTKGKEIKKSESKIFKTYSNSLSNIGRDEKFTKKNGQEFFVDFIATPIIENDRVEKVIVVFSDVTENKTNRDKVLELFDELGIFFRTNMNIEEKVEVVSTYLMDDDIDKNSISNIKNKVTEIEKIFEELNKNEWVQLYSNIWKVSENLKQRKDRSFIEP